MYNREKAVEYALTYGLNPNPNYHYFKIYGNIGGDCTNFVSQCLVEGGIPQAKTGKAPWWYRDQTNWSISWVNAHSLYWCMLIREEQNLPGLRGVEVSSVDHLTLGDIIFYEDLNGGIDHGGIITGFRDGLPTITQHSPELVNISYIKTNKGKMHFVKVTSE